MFRGLLSIILPGWFSKWRISKWRNKSKRRGGGINRVSGANFAPSGAEVIGNPKVLLADLTGDRDGAATERISQALGQCSCLVMFRTNKPLKMGGGNDLGQQLLGAAKIGREWMQGESADLLVWGDVTAGGLRLRFLPLVPDADNLPGAVGPGDALDLPARFGEAFIPVIQAATLAAVGPTFKGSKSRIAEFIERALQGARGFIDNPPEDQAPGMHASILTNLGNAFAAHYRLGGGAKKLAHAGTVYRMALKKMTPAAEPETWAITQSHMAAVLKAHGEGGGEVGREVGGEGMGEGKGEAKGEDEGEGKDKDEDEGEDATAHLKRVAAAYRQITQTLTRVAHPHNWALAHVNHGLVLYQLSARSGRASDLKEAGKSFEDALSVYTKEAMPGRWVEVSNQYGVILLAMGEQVTGNATLEHAVMRFRQVLAVCSRDKVPLLWAQTANNLGAASFSLAKRNTEAALLHEAMSCFEGAAEVYESAGDTNKAEVIRKNLHRVERLLAAQGG